MNCYKGGRMIAKDYQRGVQSSFLESVFDSVPANIAVLDREGWIVSVNEPWRIFAVANGADASKTGVGVNYFDICREAQGSSSEQARECLEGLLRVRNGSASQVDIEYPCHAPDEQRWFLMRAVRLRGQDGILVSHFNVTERKLSEKHRIRAEERFRALIEHSLDGICLFNRHAEIQYLSPSGLRILGYPLGELAGHVFFDRVYPEDCEFLKPLFEKVLSVDGGIESAQFRWRNGKGNWRWIEGTAKNLLRQPSVGAVVCNFRDITDRKQWVMDLQESEDRFRDLFENASDMIQILSPEGRFQYVNRTFRNVLGYAPGELARLNVMDVVHPESREHCRQMFKALCQGHDFERVEASFLSKHGRKIEVEGRCNARFVEGKLISVRGIFRDVSRRNRAERELRRLNRELEERVKHRTRALEAARQRAESADRVKSVFLATMSHELRTPLNSIIGFTGILHQGMAGPLNPEQRKQLEMVLNSARHLLELVNDVLDISKIEAGQLEVLWESFDFPASLRKIEQAIRPQAKKKNLELSVSISPEVGRVVSDRTRIEQVLLNLANNAVKFTQTGSVRI